MDKFVITVEKSQTSKSTKTVPLRCLPAFRNEFYESKKGTLYCSLFDSRKLPVEERAITNTLFYPRKVGAEWFTGTFYGDVKEYFDKFREALQPIIAANAGDRPFKIVNCSSGESMMINAGYSSQMVLPQLEAAAELVRSKTIPDGKIPVMSVKLKPTILKRRDATERDKVSSDHIIYEVSWSASDIDFELKEKTQKAGGKSETRDASTSTARHAPY